MIVISITDCPPTLRGDLTKWLFEINVGVYVGQVSARVRDELWDRIIDNCKVGRVTMVYQTNNEQRMAFRVHNSDWKPIDFDGLTLMLRPVDGYLNRPSSLRPGFSKAAQHQIVKRIQAAEMRKTMNETEFSDDEESGVNALKLSPNDEDEIGEEQSNDISTQQININIENTFEQKFSRHIDNSDEVQPNIPSILVQETSKQPAQAEKKHPRKSSTEPILIEKLYSNTEHFKDTIFSSKQTVSKDQNATPKKDEIVKTAVPHDNAPKIISNHTPLSNESETYVVIDLETTGLNEIEHDIIEFGAIRIKNGKITERFQRLVSIDSDVPEFITQLTGITNDMLDESGILLKNALEEFMHFIQNDILIAHNIEFDMKFINTALELFHKPKLQNGYRCTLNMSKSLLVNVKSHKLKSLIQYFNIESSGEHRSLADCESVFRLYEILKQKEKTRQNR